MHQAAARSASTPTAATAGLSHLRIVLLAQRALYGTCHVAGRALDALYCAYRPDAGKAVHHENLFGIEHVSPRQGTPAARETQRARGFDHAVAGHAGHAAALERRRHHDSTAHDEYVRHRAADHPSLKV